MQNNLKCISLREAQEIALKITTIYEGGHALNYKALADNFDGQGISFGLIQWNLGSGTLGPILLEMRNKDAVSFDNCFSPELNLLDLIIALQDKNISSQKSWAISAQQNYNQAWKSAFTSLGSITSFNDIQFNHAVKYHKGVVSCINKMRELNPELMEFIEVRTYVALFDLSVQQGNLNKANDLIDSEYPSNIINTQKELLRFVCQKRALTANKLYIADCMSRRLSIIEGKTVEYIHTYKDSNNSDVTQRSARKNANLTLIVEGIIDEFI